MVQKTISQAEAREAAEAAEAIKKRAARQAAKALAEPLNIPSVECTVLPMGDGKISMGQHVAGLGEAYYEEAEKFTVQLPVALSLYERGFVNFDGARQALADAKTARASAERAERAADAELRKLIEES